MNLFRILARKDNNQLKLQRSETGEDWVVKKGFSVLYIGTKEKCQIFIKQGLTTA